MKEHLETIKKLILENKSNREIGKLLNLSPKSIAKVRYYYDLPRYSKQIKYKTNSDRIKGYMIRNSKFSAKRRGLEFDLVYSDIELPTHCPILNIPLTYNKEGDYNPKFNNFNHASLDRIDNNKGYIKGNVMVISRLANAMKNQATFDELEIFSKNINILIQHYKNHGALGSITDIFPNINLKT